MRDVLVEADKEYNARLKKSGLDMSDNQVMQATNLQKYKNDVMKKVKAFGLSLCELGMDDEEVKDLLVRYTQGLFDQIGDVALCVGPALSALADAASISGSKPARDPTQLTSSHEDDDVSVLTADSIGFSAGEDEEGSLDDFRKRELTAEEAALLEEMKEALTSGELQHIGSVRKENFDRLRGKNFGGEDLIDLTIMEHNLRYDDADDDEDDDAPTGTKNEPAKNAQSSSRRQKMQLNMMSMLQEQTMTKIIEHYDFSDLARFKTETEKNIRLLRSFTALQAIKYYHDGGNFMDVLTVHRDILDRAIQKKGGWPAAMEEVKAETTNLTKESLANTDHWPEFFRVKVLEFYKRSLQSQQERFQLTMDLFQQRA